MQQKISKDTRVAALIAQELERQKNNLVLIASENYASVEVIAAQGSVLTNKYAEGYPGKRYYAGCEFVDQIEQLAIDRACELFNVRYVNVQPHSGSQANLAVFKATLKPGDTFMGLDLAHGGHLSHGCAVNISGQYYNAVSYKLNSETEALDYDAIEAAAIEHKPKLIIAGFSAYSLVIDWQRLREICDRVGARLHADIAHVAGMVAVGLFPSPVPYADVITTTTHKSLRGPRGGMIMVPSDAALAKKIDQAIFPGLQGGPLMQVIAAKAIAFHEALQPQFEDYQQSVLTNAKAMCDEFQKLGYRITSHKTDTHLFLVDLSAKSMTGKEAEAALNAIGIVLNKNTVPNDKRSPFVTSGVRIGTCGITTRGFDEGAVRHLVRMIDECWRHVDDAQIQQKLAEQVQALCVQYPIYEEVESDVVSQM